MKSLRIVIIVLFVSVVATRTTEAQPVQRFGNGGNGANAQGKRQAEATWLMNPVRGENLHYKTFDSQTAGEKVSYLIYLPPNYDVAKDERYPVVYWLHGIGGNQTGVPNFCRRLTEAIDTGKAPSMIFVFVNGMVDSFYCDAIKEKRAVEAVIINDLIPHIDATYRTIALRDARMIEGFSMGGFGAAHLGFKYPDLFGSISIMDGAILGLEEMKRRHRVQFERIFASSDQNFNAQSPFALAEANADKARNRTKIRMEVGALVPPNEAFHKLLERLSITHTYKAHDGVGHNHAAILDKLGDENWSFYTKSFGSAIEKPKN